MTHADLLREWAEMFGGPLRSAVLAGADALDEVTRLRAGVAVGLRAAPPADLVALVREWQEAVKDEACYLCGPEPESPARVFDINERKRAAKNGILAYPLPAALRVPDTPQGRCARWPACKWDSEGGKIHTCSICGPECSC